MDQLTRRMCVLCLLQLLKKRGGGAVLEHLDRTGLERLLLTPSSQNRLHTVGFLPTPVASTRRHSDQTAREVPGSSRAQECSVGYDARSG